MGLAMEQHQNYVPINAVNKVLYSDKFSGELSVIHLSYFY